MAHAKAMAMAQSTAANLTPRPPPCSFYLTARVSAKKGIRGAGRPPLPPVRDGQRRLVLARRWRTVGPLARRDGLPRWGKFGGVSGCKRGRAALEAARVLLRHVRNRGTWQKSRYSHGKGGGGGGGGARTRIHVALSILVGRGIIFGHW